MHLLKEKLCSRKNCGPQQGELDANLEMETDNAVASAVLNAHWHIGGMMGQARVLLLVLMFFLLLTCRISLSHVVSFPSNWS